MGNDMFVIEEEHQGAPRFSHVPTLSLLGYLTTIHAWFVEAGMILLHVLTDRKLDPTSHGALLAVATFLTGFSWLRRGDFQALRHTRGKMPLTSLQMLLITAYVLALGCFGAWIIMELQHA